MQNHRLQAHTAVLLANIIFGLGVPVTKLLLDQWVSPMAYMATRCLGAAAIFWLISLFLPREKVAPRDLTVIILGGLLGIVVCAALFIGEKISTRGVVGVALGVAGAMLMVFIGWQGGSGKNDILGIALTLLSMFTWAVYLIITRKVSARYTAVTQMKWVFLASAIAVLPFSLTDLQSAPLYSVATQWSGLAEMAFIVVFATVAGYFAIPFAMRYLKATTVSVYTNLQPIVASLVAIALSQDVLTWDKPVALVLVLLSAWLVTK